MFIRHAFLFFCVLFVNGALPFEPDMEPIINQRNLFKFDNAIPFSSGSGNIQDAFVLNSNLPLKVQIELASALTLIYRKVADPLQRLRNFQTELSRMYNIYWNVVSNFDNITYYSQLFIDLQMNNDRIFAFGLS